MYACILLQGWKSFKQMHLMDFKCTSSKKHAIHLVDELLHIKILNIFLNIYLIIIIIQKNTIVLAILKYGLFVCDEHIERWTLYYYYVYRTDRKDAYRKVIFKYLIYIHSYTF